MMQPRDHSVRIVVGPGEVILAHRASGARVGSLECQCGCEFEGCPLQGAP